MPITFIMFRGSYFHLDTKLYASIRLFGYSSLPFRYALIVSSTSFPYLVRGHRIGSAYVDISSLLLCHFNLFICHVLAGLVHCLQLVYNIFPISAYVPTTMNHNINSVSKSVKESLVRCSLVLTVVVKSHSASCLVSC